LTVSFLPNPVASAADPAEFENLISDTSALLLAAPAEQVDFAIEATLRSVGTYFSAERSLFLNVSADQTFASVAYAAYANGVPVISGNLNLAELFPWAVQRLLDQRPVIVRRMTDLPPEAMVDRASWQQHTPMRSNLAVPICDGPVVRHVIVLHWVTEECMFPDAHVPRLRVLGEMMLNALRRKQAVDVLRQSEARLERALEEIATLRDRLEHENVQLRREESPSGHSDLIVGRSPAIHQALALAGQVAATTANVLLLGATGTGKERFASFIHHASGRRARPMVHVNCSAIPSGLIESELFGREKGAYTGAMSKQIGRFELAHGSTLFLDEVGELPLEVQVKLLRVLEERTIERLGSPRPIPVDVRIIAATNRDLEQAVREGDFRTDLFYRLNVFPIIVPALRDRREDIPALVSALMDEIGSAMGKRFDGIAKVSLERLQRCDWPGNVRELRNVLERAMILCPGPILKVDLAEARNLVSGSRARSASSDALEGVEREHILRVLSESMWRIKGADSASSRLEMKPSTLRSRMKKLDIVRPS
jgi:formate hydrogenlyase transcriptional activator